MDAPETVSLLGRPLARLEADAARRSALEAAERAARERPDDVERLLALGIAQGRAWRYRDSIATWTRMMDLAPGDWRPHCYRGHRRLSIRELDPGALDLERALALGGTASFEVRYHLALAHSLRGDWEKAIEAWRRCLEGAATDADLYGYAPEDKTMPAAHWLFMALQRTGRREEAQALLDGIPEGVPVERSPHRETEAYYEALRFAKGLRTPEALVENPRTQGPYASIATHALGNWHLSAGRAGPARGWFERAAADPLWPAFSVIAAEAELVRMVVAAPKPVR